MSIKQIICEKCKQAGRGPKVANGENVSGEMFGAFVISGKDTDTHTYIELCCPFCDTQFHFVVDLTPDFERV